MNIFESGDPSSVRRGRVLAEKVFGEGWAGKGEGVYDEGAKDARVWGIGQYVYSPHDVAIH